MDDSTKKMLVTIGAGVLKKGLLGLGATMATHGIIASNQTETVVSVGMAIAGIAWSFWDDYGRAIVLSQLEVLKAKSLAQAEKMKTAGVPPVTVNQIAEQSPKLSPADVTKTVATLPAAVQATVKVLLVAFLLSAFLAGDARAQPPLPKPKLGPIGTAVEQRLDGAQSGPLAGKLTGSAITDIQSFLNAKFLPDLQYALKLSQASKNTVTSDCYQAWIDIITTQQNAVKGQDGTDMAMPDPHVITDFEKLVELRNALQPESQFMVKCSPVASMLKRDIASFMGIVISGGAGLATLVPGL